MSIDFSAISLDSKKPQLKSIEPVKDFTPKFKCEICTAGYMAEGYLKKHMNEKHGLGTGKLFECTECNSFLSSKQALEKHVKRMHRVCKICKEEFASEIDKDKHQAIHTTCGLCGLVLPTASKLNSTSTLTSTQPQP